MVRKRRKAERSEIYDTARVTVEAPRSHFKELSKISHGQTETFGSSLQQNHVKIGCTRVSCLLQKQPLNAIN